MGYPSSTRLSDPGSQLLALRSTSSTGRRRSELGSGHESISREREIVVAAKQGGPRERERFVETFRPSVARIARLYRNSTRVEWNELMQEGVVGLLRALERYDVELGVPFWAYATWWVRQAMQQVVSELSRPIVLSDRALRQLARVKEAQRKFEQTRGRSATYDDLANGAGLPRRQVESLICTDRAPRGLDEPAGGETGDRTTPGEMLADPPAEDAYQSAERRLLAAQLPGLLAHLSERERTIICSRFGIGRRPQTLREIAEFLGMSAERVRQIEQASLDKLTDAAA
ncbi:MAG: sigma-70 family RNA polymerase sigma factor [Solirubrobacteraceae bacterium]